MNKLMPQESLSLSPVDPDKYVDFGGFIAEKGLKKKLIGSDKIDRINMAITAPMAIAGASGFLGIGKNSPRLLKNMMVPAMIGSAANSVGRLLQSREPTLEGSKKYKTMALAAGAVPTSYSIFRGVENLKSIKPGSGFLKKLLAASPLVMAPTYIAMPFVINAIRKKHTPKNLKLRSNTGRLELYEAGE